jgi:ferredoxin-NADP reductase
MPVITYTVGCLRNDIIADGVYEFALEKPVGFTFKPGQFVLFDVALIENPADVQTRAFSIASAPSEDTLLFVAKMIPGGRASRWIEETLKKGTEVIMKGPFGNFVLAQPQAGTPASESRGEGGIVFIATSTGIAPFRSMIVDTLSRGDTRRMDLIFGVKTEKDLFWVTEMESIAREHGNFFMHVTLSEPVTEWKSHRGWVQAIAPQVVKDFSRAELYVCGNPNMTKDVKELALTKWGMDKKQVHVEGYI